MHFDIKWSTMTAIGWKVLIQVEILVEVVEQYVMPVQTIF
jgi:hypothetical protein